MVITLKDKNIFSQEKNLLDKSMILFEKRGNIHIFDGISMSNTNEKDNIQRIPL